MQEKPVASKPSSRSSGAKQTSDGWGVDDFTVDTSVPSASSYNWDHVDVNQDDFFNSVISDTKKVSV